MQPGKHTHVSTISSPLIDSLKYPFLILPKVQKSKTFPKSNLTNHIKRVTLEVMLKINNLPGVGYLVETRREKGNAIINRRLMTNERGHGVQGGKLAAL